MCRDISIQILKTTKSCFGGPSRGGPHTPSVVPPGGSRQETSREHPDGGRPILEMLRWPPMSKDLWLVTGGAGFIGSHLVEGLVRRGQRVRVLDNLSTGRREKLASVRGKIEFIKGDITRPADCAKACKGATFVLHQAAIRSCLLYTSDAADE